MPRGIPKRLTAILGVVLFLLTTAGEGFGLHPCPYHDSEASGESEPAAVAEHAGVDHTSSSHHAGHTPKGETKSPDHHAGADPCTHFEACQSAANAVLHVEVAGIAIWTFTTHTHVGIVAHEQTLPSPPPYLLPYSQAPPARG